MWFIALALATPGEIADDGSSVRRIRWAQPFQFTEPARYGHTATPRVFDHGWLIELEVDPAFMVPRQVGVPVLWIGDDLAVRTNWDYVSGCAVVWVPDDHDLRTERIFFGSTTLPERMDSERRALDHHAADQLGIKRIDPAHIDEIDGPTLALTDLQGLMKAAADRIERCSNADDARLPALRGK